MGPGRRTLTRRELLEAGGGAALVLALASCGGREQPAAGPFGALEPDPDGVLDLPAGFRYRILSLAGSELRDGRLVPANPDGMGAFAGPDGATVLVRNHELASGEGHPVIGTRPYDPREPGCTTAVVVDRDRRQVDAFVTSSGTRLNCAGGATPWGTWLTCEETRAEGHGYVFEVQWDDPEGELSRRPIEGMGRFAHEAAAVDQGSGAVYLTEDGVHDDTSPGAGGDDRPSFLYRYLPDDLRPKAGALHAGGRLQALVFDPAGEGPWQVRWADVDPASAHEAAERAGAGRFRRLEGCCLSRGALWFDDTSGGEAELGQLFRYAPAAERLELVLEARDAGTMRRPDNLAEAPWGDLVVVEDGEGEDRVLGLTPAGELYTLARAPEGSRIAGPCFSPNGRTFFLNAYRPGFTLAIWGPFPRGP